MICKTRLLFKICLIILVNLNACKNSNGQFSSDYPNDWQKKQLKGKVKSVKKNTYAISGNKDKWTKGKKYPSGNYKYLYDRNGMLIETHIYYDNQFFGKELHTYDETNHLKESKAVDESGSFLAKKVGSFDRKKKLHILKQYDTQNNLINTQEIYEDEQGNVIKEIRKTPLGINYITKSEYDQKNKLIKQVSKAYNKKLYFNYTAIHKNYDTQGSVTLIKIHNQDIDKKSLQTIQYKYDSQGNWIEMIQFMDDIAINITEREIEYY